MVKSRFFQLAFLVLFFNITIVNAANKTWIGNGSNTSWKKASNWSGGIPGPSDIAIFSDGGTGNCSIDTATVSIAGIQMNTGYTGTLTQSGTNTSFTIGTSNGVFSTGTFVGGNAPITFNGSFTLSGTNFTSTSGTLTFNDAVNSTSGTFTHNGGTVVYNSTNTTNIYAWNYYNLTISNDRSIKSVVFSSTGTIGIAGTFVNSAVFSTGGFVTTGSTVNYNGSGAQTITPFSYNNLTSSSTGTRAITGVVKIKGKFNKGTNTFTSTGSTVEYNGTGGQTIIAFTYYNLVLSGTKTVNDSLANSGSITINNSFVNSATFSSGKFITSFSTVLYNTGTQNVIAFPYYNLTLQGTHTSNLTFVNGDTIKVANIFNNTTTFSSGSIINTGNTFQYNGTGAQTIKAINYNNLVISGTRSGNITLVNLGVIGISGVLSYTATYTSGGLINTSSTIDYNGTGQQTIKAFDYNNLIISGARTSNNVILSNGGSIKIAKAFSPFATFTTGGYITLGSTIEYNGSQAQAISPFVYKNLISSSTGERSFATTGTVRIDSIFTQGGNVYKNYGLAGEGYSSINSTRTESLLGVSSVGTSTVYVCGIGGIIGKTSDGGVTWSYQKIGTNDFYSIKFYDANNGIAVGNAGAIAVTINGGSSWSLQAPYPTYNLRYVYYVTSSLVFAVGGNGIVLKSTNSGTSWLTPSFITSQGLYGMYFTHVDTGYVSGLGGVLFKTSNGGTSWSTLTSGITDQLSSIKFISPSTGFAVSNGGKIIKTIDRGNSWSLITSGTTDPLGVIEFVDASTGFIFGGNATNNTGLILKTSDGGDTWNLMNTGTNRLYSGTLWNSSVGYIVGIDGCFMKYTCCTDGGTVQFNSNLANTIPTLNYNNLTIAGTHTGNNVTLASSGTIGVSGTLSNIGTFSSGGSIVTTGSTIDFNGGAKNIPLFTFNNVTISGTGDKTATGDLTVNGILDINTSRVLNMGTNALSGTLASVTGAGTLRTQNISSTPISAGKTWTPIVEYNSASGTAQTIVYGSYKDLNGTGGNRILSSTDTVRISGVFTKGSGTYTVTGSTVDFNGTTQSIPAITSYNNLKVSGTGNKSAAAALIVNGKLIVNANAVLDMISFGLFGSLTSTNGTGTVRTQATGANILPVGKAWLPTVEYNSTIASQTIVYGSYKDLNGTGNIRTLSSTDTVHISGTFSIGAGAYTVTSSTVDFNGSTQSVPVLTSYNNLKISGTGSKSSSGALTVNGGLMVSANSILDLATYNLSGTLSSITGTGTIKTQATGSTPIPSGKTWSPVIEYNGAAQTAVTGTYSTLIISGTGDKTGGALGVTNLTVNAGRILDVGLNAITGSITSTAGTGIIKTQNTSATPIPVNKTWSCGIQYNSISSQNIVSGNYSDLDGTAGNRVLSSTGTIGISGVFTKGAGTYTITGSTLDFNGSVAQSIPVFNYNNLIISGTRTNTSVTLASGAITVSGNLAVNSTFTSGAFITTGNTILFNSTSNQYINGNSIAYFDKLSVNKTAGKVRLYQPSVVNKQLVLTKGIVSCSATNYLQFNNGVDTVLGASDSSYVCGSIKKVGNQIFKFPLGDTTLSSGAYHPLSITAPTNATDAFTAQYYAMNQTTGSSVVDSIEISNCEYWTIARNVGTSNIKTTLNWNTNNCLSTNLYDMAVSSYDVSASKWKSLNNTSISITGSKGFVSASLTPFWNGTSASAITLGRKKTPTFNEVIVEPYCISGITTGNINVTITNGAPPFAYSWSNGANTEDITGLAANNYNLIITDRFNRTFTKEYTLENCLSWATLPTTLSLDSAGTLHKTGNDTTWVTAQSSHIIDSLATTEWIKYTVSDTTSHFLLGFGSVEADSLSDEANIMTYIDGKNLTVIETDNDGFYSKIIIGTVAVGDVIKTEINETEGIMYYVNGNLQYTGKLLSNVRLQYTANLTGVNTIKNIRCSSNN